MANITNTAIINITATEDTSQNVIVNRTVPNLNFDSNVADGVIYASLANGANILTLPTVDCYQFYLRNNDPALLITPQVDGQSLPQLYPGEVCLIWKKVTGGAPITAITLTASGANALCEYFIGG